MNDLSLIGRNLFRRKLRTALMVASILIGFAIFGVLAAFDAAFKGGEDMAAADRLVVVNKINFTQPLPISYRARIAAVEGVRQVFYASWFGGYYQDPKNLFAAFAVEPQSYLDVYADLIAVSPEARRAFLANRTGTLVGEAMAKKWGWKIGDHIPISSNIYSKKDGSHSWDMTVVGIISPVSPRVDTNFIVFQYDYLNETRTFDRDNIGWLGLITANSSINERVSKTIDQMFANSPYETTTDTEKAFNKGFAAQFGNIALIVKLVVGAAFVTILMIVGNTMAMAIRERTREIGVLKTLGFPNGRILRLVLGESLFLAVLGGAPGLALAIAFTTVVRGYTAGVLPALIVSPGICAIGVALMIGLGLATGTIPAITAMRINIAVALGKG